MAGRVGFGDEQRGQGGGGIDENLDGEDENMAGRMLGLVGI